MIVNEKKARICRAACRIRLLAKSALMCENYISLRPSDINEGGYFLKKLWCCVGGDVKNKILDLSIELIR